MHFLFKLYGRIWSEYVSKLCMLKEFFTHLLKPCIKKYLKLAYLNATAAAASVENRTFTLPALQGSGIYVHFDWIFNL